METGKLVVVVLGVLFIAGFIIALIIAKLSPRPQNKAIHPKASRTYTESAPKNVDASSGALGAFDPAPSDIIMKGSIADTGSFGMLVQSVVCPDSGPCSRAVPFATDPTMLSIDYDGYNDSYNAFKPGGEQDTLGLDGYNGEGFLVTFYSGGDQNPPFREMRGAAVLRRPPKPLSTPCGISGAVGRLTGRDAYLLQGNGIKYDADNDFGSTTPSETVTIFQTDDGKIPFNEGDDAASFIAKFASAEAGSFSGGYPTGVSKYVLVNELFLMANDSTKLPDGAPIPDDLPQIVDGNGVLFRYLVVAINAAYFYTAEYYGRIEALPKTDGAIFDENGMSYFAVNDKALIQTGLKFARLKLYNSGLSSTWADQEKLTGKAVLTAGNYSLKIFAPDDKPGWHISVVDKDNAVVTTVCDNFPDYNTYVFETVLAGAAPIVELDRINLITDGSDSDSDSTNPAYRWDKFTPNYGKLIHGSTIGPKPPSDGEILILSWTSTNTGFTYEVKAVNLDVNSALSPAFTVSCTGCGIDDITIESATNTPPSNVSEYRVTLQNQIVAGESVGTQLILYGSNNTDPDVAVLVCQTDAKQADIAITETPLPSTPAGQCNCTADGGDGKCSTDGSADRPCGDDGVTQAQCEQYTSQSSCEYSANSLYGCCTWTPPSSDSISTQYRPTFGFSTPYKRRMMLHIAYHPKLVNLVLFTAMINVGYFLRLQRVMFSGVNDWDTHVTLTNSGVFGFQSFSSVNSYPNASTREECAGQNLAFYGEKAIFYSWSDNPPGGQANCFGGAYQSTFSANASYGCDKDDEDAANYRTYRLKDPNTKTLDWNVTPATQCGEVSFDCVGGSCLKDSDGNTIGTGASVYKQVGSSGMLQPSISQGQRVKAGNEGDWWTGVSAQSAEECELKCLATPPTDRRGGQQGLYAYSFNQDLQSCLCFANGAIGCAKDGYVIPFFTGSFNSEETVVLPPMPTDTQTPYSAPLQKALDVDTPMGPGSSITSGDQNNYITIQGSDGNFVLYTSNNDPVQASGGCDSSDPFYRCEANNTWGGCPNYEATNSKVLPVGKVIQCINDTFGSEPDKDLQVPSDTENRTRDLRLRCDNTLQIFEWDTDKPPGADSDDEYGDLSMQITGDEFKGSKIDSCVVEVNDFKCYSSDGAQLWSVTGEATASVQNPGTMVGTAKTVIQGNGSFGLVEEITQQPYDCQKNTFSANLVQHDYPRTCLQSLYGSCDANANQGVNGSLLVGQSIYASDDDSTSFLASESGYTLKIERNADTGLGAQGKNWLLLRDSNGSRVWNSVDNPPTGSKQDYTTTITSCTMASDGLHCADAASNSITFSINLDPKDDYAQLTLDEDGSLSMKSAKDQKLSALRVELRTGPDGDQKTYRKAMEDLSESCLGANPLMPSISNDSCEGAVYIQNTSDANALLFFGSQPIVAQNDTGWQSFSGQIAMTQDATYGTDIGDLRTMYTPTLSLGDVDVCSTADGGASYDCTLQDNPNTYQLNNTYGCAQGKSRNGQGFGNYDSRNIISKGCKFKTSNNCESNFKACVNFEGFPFDLKDWENACSKCTDECFTSHQSKYWSCVGVFAGQASVGALLVATGAYTLSAAYFGGAFAAGVELTGGVAMETAGVTVIGEGGAPVAADMFGEGLVAGDAAVDGMSALGFSAPWATTEGIEGIALTDAAITGTDDTVIAVSEEVDTLADAATAEATSAADASAAQGVAAEAATTQATQDATLTGYVNQLNTLVANYNAAAAEFFGPTAETWAAIQEQVPTILDTMEGSWPEEYQAWADANQSVIARLNIEAQNAAIFEQALAEQGGLRAAAPLVADLEIGQAAAADADWIDAIPEMENIVIDPEEEIAAQNEAEQRRLRRINDVSRFNKGPRPSPFKGG